MFEIMITDAENNDGDEWMAKMHTDERFPGSDITFSNIETGEELEVSLKALSSEGTKIIESALAKYPDIPIMTTKEMSDLLVTKDLTNTLSDPWNPNAHYKYSIATYKGCLSNKGQTTIYPANNNMNQVRLCTKCSDDVPMHIDKIISVE